MSFFQNSRIWVRIALAVAVPMLGVVGLAAVQLTQKAATLREMSSLSDIAQLAPAVSDVVHEMQKERGRSAGFIASKGASFAEELAQQRQETDGRLGRLDEALERFAVADYGSAFAEKVATARRSLGELDARRQSVSALTDTVAEMAAYYGRTIVELLATIEEMGVISSNARVTNRIAAYTAILQAKERAGRERAMGAAGFGGGFEPGIYRSFVKMIAMQEALIEVFAKHATQDQAAFYAETMRTKAFESADSGSAAEITAAQWFAAITAKIDLLKRVEDRMAADLTMLTEQLASGAQSSLTMTSAAVLGLLAAAGLLVWFLVRGITGPLARVVETTTRLAEHDLEVTVPDAERGDELGDLARALVVFKEGSIEMERLKSEQREQERRAAEDKRRAMQQLADEFEGSVGVIANNVTSAATEMEASAKQMADTARSVGDQATSVAAAAGQASANVQTVASATEEMSASVSEIGIQVERAKEISDRAVSESANTNKSISSLSESAQKIGEVIGLIQDIAEQTNLLALNATIESARAGEAGKGFAVVAAEVKALANQTAAATDQISEQIAAIQGSTNSAIAAIRRISATVDEIKEVSGSIAAAIEEQITTNQEISRNVQEVAEGNDTVSANIGSVTAAISETSSAASQMHEAAIELSRQGESLTSKVQDFLGQVRAS